MNADWSSLTSEQKKQRRFEAWLNPPVEFVSPEAERSYKVRAQRFIDAYNLQKPDRVPVTFRVGNLPLELAGINYKTSIYDHQAAVAAFDRFNSLYSEELDLFAIPNTIPAKAFDILDYRLYRYPGHGLGDNNPGFQFVEGEYMMADEYDDLIRDPSDFWLRTYLPRIFHSLSPLNRLNPLTSIVEIVSVGLSPLADAGTRSMLKKVIEAGEEIEKEREIDAGYALKGAARGFPGGGMGIFCKAPFDVIGDTLRGTTGVMKDMYRQPEKLKKAMDVITDVMIANTLRQARSLAAYFATFPLHKGADGWMSQKQFETFYWPTLKKVIDALIAEGILVICFAEGKFESRLPLINEFPRGAVCWWFDQTDMVKAKKILGNNCCIQGNVPSSLLQTGTPGDVEKYCRKLIEECGEDGGFILSPGATPDYPKLDNLRAMVAAAREYGTYR